MASFFTSPAGTTAEQSGSETGRLISTNQNLFIIKIEVMEPVMIVLTPDGKLVRAGDPKLPKPKELADYVRSGYEIKTITIDEFRATKWVWHWEK